MTPEYGFLMLLMGLTAILVGAVITYLIINKVHNENNINN